MKRVIVGLMAVCGLMSSGIQAKPLWNNLTTEMTKEEVRALYPPTKGLYKAVRIPLEGHCIVEMGFHYGEDGKLDSVKMVYSQKSLDSCVDQVARGMDAKYGTPDESYERTGEAGECGTGIVAALCSASNSGTFQKRRYKVWKLESGVEVTMKTTDNSSTDWKVEWVDVKPASEVTSSKL